MMFEELYDLIKDHEITHQTRFHKEIYVAGQKDTFVHLDMGTLRSLAKKYAFSITDNDWVKLMNHSYHEFRLLALLILIHRIKDHQSLTKAYKQYNHHIAYVNNWDLVDVSAPLIVGQYVFEMNDLDLLDDYVLSDSMWINRIGIVSCLFLVKQNMLNKPLELIKKILNHSHDLMHKANGWVLREIGKKNIDLLNQFIKNHYHQMPRTTLRYAIEKHNKDIRKRILGGDFTWI
jgi:3-methyladenine DNA glycosylase AlkD